MAWEDLVTDPHLLATGFFSEHEDPGLGRLRQPGVAVRFDGQRPPVAVPPRQRFRTFRRTITETDLVNFVAVTGMLEPLFIDTTHRGAMAGRPVPAALTYAIIEGFLLRSLVQGVGLALLEMSQRAHAPVCVGDTIRATVEITDIRPTSKDGRAVVASAVTVLNQRDEVVLTYEVKRLQAG